VSVRAKQRDLHRDALITASSEFISHFLIGKGIHFGWVGGGGVGSHTLSIFFPPEKYFGGGGYWVEETQIKNLGVNGGKLCAYIQEWVKPKPPPIFRTWPFPKLKLLIPIVDFAPWSLTCYWTNHALAVKVIQVHIRTDIGVTALGIGKVDGSERGVWINIVGLANWYVDMLIKRNSTWNIVTDMRANWEWQQYGGCWDKLLGVQQAKEGG